MPQLDNETLVNNLVSRLSEDPDITDIRWAAYMLATVKHECADTWAPIVERGTPAYCKKYDPGTKLGTALGNTQPGDGYRFRGRGYVQITGRANYARLGKMIGRSDELVRTPELATDPEVAYRIMSVGMRAGAFTGRKLSDYISATKCDYKNARRIINGADRADLIAGYAAEFERMLKSAKS
jgi:putative chitinase